MVRCNLAAFILADSSTHRKTANIMAVVRAKNTLSSAFKSFIYKMSLDMVVMLENIFVSSSLI